MASVLINVTKACEGKPSIQVLYPLPPAVFGSVMTSADAHRLGHELQMAADWASEIEAEAPCELDLKAVGD